MTWVFHPDFEYTVYSVREVKMMKIYFMKAALLALLAGVALSAGAKPGEVRQREDAVAAGHQSGNLTVAARGFLGSRPRIDTPISCAKPKGA